LIAEIELKFVFGIEADDRGEGLPCRLRKPCSGPSCFSRINPLDFPRGSMNRLDRNVGRLKSHF